MAESGYYEALTRAPSARSIRHAWLLDQIREVHQASNGTYGARRVHAALVLGRGITVGHNAVEILMARNDIRGVTGRPRWKRPRPDLIGKDLVNRDFARQGPNQLWVVTDITEHPTREGKVYCAVVLDVYSRRVVGWSIDASPTAALVTNALGMAIESRTPPAGAVIHSDRGTQFGSWAFTDRAKASGLVPSMGSIADCFDCETAVRRPVGLTRAYDWPCGCPGVDLSAARATPPQMAHRAGSDLIAPLCVKQTERGGSSGRVS